MREQNNRTNEGFESRGVRYDIIAEIPCLINQLFVKFKVIITRKAMDVKFNLKYLSEITNSRIQVKSIVDLIALFEYLFSIIMS